MSDRQQKTLEERFWAKVQKSDACWGWIGSRQHNGYGYLHFGGKTKRKPLRAHRVSWALHFGEVPEGLSVLHQCDNPSCVRPDHLFLGDRSANMQDCAAKKRGCTVGKSRLTHCVRGHAFTPENTIRKNKGRHRACRICTQANARRRYAAAIRARGSVRPSL